MKIWGIFLLIFIQTFFESTLYVFANGDIAGNPNQSLLERVSQLEIKQQRDVDQLHAKYQNDINILRRALDKQTERVELLETTVQRQERQMKRVLAARVYPDVNGHEMKKPPKRDLSTTFTAKQKPRIRRTENEVNIAFTCTLSKIASNLGANQTIVFDNVLVNIGNAYNRHAGVFIAPVAGTYVFSVTLMTSGHHNTHYALFKNSSRQVNFHLNGSANINDSGSQTIVLQLAQGDDVTVKHVDSNHDLYGYSYSSFSGFLLVQDFTGGSSVVVGK